MWDEVDIPGRIHLPLDKEIDRLEDVSVPLHVDKDIWLKPPQNHFVYVSQVADYGERATAADRTKIQRD